MNLAEIALNSFCIFGKNEEVELYQSAGEINHNGLITKLYYPSIKLNCHIQPESIGKLEYKEARDVSSYISRFYYSCSQTALSSLDSIRGSNGDLFKCKDGTIWLLTEIIDDFSSDNDFSSWQCARGILQKKDFEIVITDQITT